MASSYNDRTGRQKILEGLWLIGIEPGQLNVSADLDGNAFLDTLHRNGVNDDFIRRAVAGVDWRADSEGKAPLFMKIASLLRASGYRPDEVQRFYDAANQTGITEDAGRLTQLLTSQFNERTAGAMIYKATGGKDVAGAVWNPFRTDAPPKSADTRYGGGGILATNLAPGMTSAEPTNRFAQPGSPNPTVPTSATSGVPTPPASMRATPTASLPAAPPSGAALGGPGAGAGGGGGGANNQPPPPSTWNDDQIRTFIKQNFGANAYFVDIPEVWEALRTVVKSGKGAAGLEPALEGTAFYKSNKAAARLWYIEERSDPAQTAADIAQQTQAIQNLAQQAGITIDPDRAQQMAQSYLRYGWTNTDLQRAIGAEWHYDPSSRDQAAAVTKMKDDARNWLVPLSDQAIQTWGQGLISGTATQDQYTQYLRDNAKSLLPQMSNLIDQHAGDPNFSVSTFVDPYKQHAANLLGLQPDQIDFNDSKWRKALDTVDPKTGERRIMSLGEWESTVKSDPTYGYDRTANGINDGLALANSLKTSFGF